MANFNYADFYKNKTVLPSYKFDVTLSNQNYTYIKPYHVVDVTIPMYKFGAQETKYGSVSRLYPTLDHKGFAVTVTYEDDVDGTIIEFVKELERTIIDKYGVHRPIPLMRQGNLDIFLYNHAGETVCRWECVNVMFGGAEDLSLSYDSSDTLKIKINYLCDVIKFYKYLEVGARQYEPLPLIKKLSGLGKSLIEPTVIGLLSKISR